MSNLSVAGQLLLALLLIVFRVGILSSSDGRLVDFDPRVAVLEHHPTLC